MDALASKLWNARKNGGTVTVDSSDEPTTMADAYAVQDEIMRLAGYPAVAFKVGSTSEEAQRLLGTSEPGSCPVLSPFFHLSPSKLAIDASHMPAVEGEFAFRLGADLPARDAAYTREDVVAAVDAVAGAIEVVGTRIAGGLAGKGRFLVTADSGANIGLVVGGWQTDWRETDLKDHAVSVSVNGEPAGSGTGERALGDPLNVLVWLANQQSARGRGLEEGTCVSTGTCTGLDPVGPGDDVLADFGTLGAVEISFE